MEKDRRFYHVNITKRLEDILESKKYKIYRRLDDIPGFIKEMENNLEDEKYKYTMNLPLDLICIKKKEDESEEGKEIRSFYTVFVVISRDKVTKSLAKILEKRLLFYKYHLSRIISTKRLKIILVAPYFTNIDDEFIEILKDNGIGFCKLFSEDEELEIKPKSIRDQIKEEFKERRIDKNEFLDEYLFETLYNEGIIKKDEQDPPFYFNDTIRSESQLKERLIVMKVENEKIEYILNAWKKSLGDIPIFFERYIHDCIDACGYRPEEFGESHLDRNIMDKIFELEKVLYKDDLIKFINIHLTDRNDEFEFSDMVFSKLWNKHTQISYTEFLKHYEQALFHIFGRKYRDHYLHQFQVFLLGLPIIDSFYNEFEKKYKSSEIIWLIVSSFHDIAYPVQLYEKWTDQFFTEIFKTNKSFGTLDLKSRFIDENFLSCLNYIVEKLYEIIDTNRDQTNIKNNLVKYLFEKITIEKNHGILGGISLLKIVYNHKLCNRDNIQKYFIPSALAITLHDIWRINTKVKEGDLQNKLREKYLNNLNFEDDPITFLLILCDSVQEWGRPLSDKQDRFYLEKFTIDPKSRTENVEIIIRSHNHTENDAIKNKQEELNDLKCFLRSSNIKFKIILQDRDGNPVGEYPIEGNEPRK